MRAVLILLAFSFWSCRQAPEVSPAAKPNGFRWARRLSWEKRDGVTHVTVSSPWKGARDSLRYALVPTGREAFAGPGETVLRIPVHSAACLVIVHVGYMKALGSAAAVMAVGDTRFVYDSTVRAGIRAGRVFEAGSSGPQVNAERLMTARPDLILANAIDVREFASLQRLRDAGLPVLITAEWMEGHPLARAEWMRLFGVLLGKEREADSLFAAVEKSYLELAARAAAQTRRPTVLMGAPFRDEWFVAGGRSFMARFLADAGADYLWASDTTVGGVSLNFESVLSRARHADFWLHPNDWSSLREGLGQDARFRAFAAFQSGKVYNNNARESQRGFSDYWESGIVNPHRVLADLISIFTGGEDSLFYYRRLR